MNGKQLIKQQQAELLKNSLDGLFALRDQLDLLSPQEAQLFHEAIHSMQTLRSHLESERDYPRWIDIWGQRRGWRILEKRNETLNE